MSNQAKKNPIDTIEKFEQFCRKFNEANDLPFVEEDLKTKEYGAKFYTIFRAAQGDSNGVIRWYEETGELEWDNFEDLEVKDLIEKLEQVFLPEDERDYPMYVKVYVKAPNRKAAVESLKVNLSDLKTQLNDKGIKVYEVSVDSYGIASC